MSAPFSQPTDDNRPVIAFPTRIVLVDTGERRAPKPEEWYCWYGKWPQEAPNTVHGPHYNDPDEDQTCWRYADWWRYAIYRKEAE